MHLQRNLWHYTGGHMHFVVFDFCIETVCDSIFNGSPTDIDCISVRSFIRCFCVNYNFLVFPQSIRAKANGKTSIKNKKISSLWVRTLDNVSRFLVRRIINPINSYKKYKIVRFEANMIHDHDQPSVNTANQNKLKLKLCICVYNWPFNVDLDWTRCILRR